VEILATPDQTLNTEEGETSELEENINTLQDITEPITVNTSNTGLQIMSASTTPSASCFCIWRYYNSGSKMGDVVRTIRHVFNSNWLNRSS
jgi:hypothetical protein